MWGIVEAVLALLCALGILSVGWILFGRMVVPSQAGKDTMLFTVLRAEGDAEGLQQTVKSLQWMDGSRLMRARIIIVDAGLSPGGRKVAENLARQQPELILCETEKLPAWILEQ